MLRNKESKGELVGIFLTAPWVKELAKNAFLSDEQVQLILQKMAESNKAVIIRVLFPQDVADHILKACPSLLGSLKRIGEDVRIIEQVEEEVEEILQDIPEPLFTDNPFIDEFELKDSPAAQASPSAPVSSSAAISKSLFDLDRIKTIVLSAIPLAASLSVNMASNKAATALVKPDDNKYAVGACNGVINTIINPYVILVINNSLASYAGNGPLVTAGLGASIAGAPVGSALLGLTFASFILKGLSYSIVRNARSWAKTACAERDQAESEAEAQNQSKSIVSLQ